MNLVIGKSVKLDLGPLIYPLSTSALVQGSGPLTQNCARYPSGVELF